jgi:hypothetical protein
MPVDDGSAVHRAEMILVDVVTVAQGQMMPHDASWDR